LAHKIIIQKWTNFANAGWHILYTWIHLSYSFL
jgi:hypothetical protein